MKTEITIEEKKETPCWQGTLERVLDDKRKMWEEMGFESVRSNLHGYVVHLGVSYSEVSAWYDAYPYPVGANIGLYEFPKRKMLSWFAEQNHINKRKTQQRKYDRFNREKIKGSAEPAIL